MAALTENTKGKQPFVVYQPFSKKILAHVCVDTAGTDYVTDAGEKLPMSNVFLTREEALRSLRKNLH